MQRGQQLGPDKLRRHSPLVESHQACGSIEIKLEAGITALEHQQRVMQLGVGPQPALVIQLHPDLPTKGKIRRRQHEVTRAENQKVGIASDNALKAFGQALLQRAQPCQIGCDHGLRTGLIQQFGSH